MIRKPLALIVPLALLLAGCEDQPLPTALAPEAPLFTQSAAGPVVNSLADPGNGTCDEAECTLREAIALASAGATITFSVTGTITLESGLELDKDLTIRGRGADRLALQHTLDEDAEPFVVVSVAPEVSVTISDLAIRGSGSDLGFGSLGIWNQGSLSLSQCAVFDHGGGAIDSRQVAVTNTGGSGAEATLQMDGCAVYDNQYVGIKYVGTLSVTNSTISRNGKFSQGGLGSGGIAGWGLLTVDHSTIVDNEECGGGSAGLYVTGVVTVTNSVITRNFSCYPGRHQSDITFYDASGTSTLDLRYSLVGTLSAPASSPAGAGTLIGVDLDPLLGPLQNNGGPTLTHALLEGSPAINAGNPTFDASQLPYDQRGEGYARVSGGRTDIGAFELQQSTTPTFGGFLPPLREGQLNVVKAGRAVPVKFSLGGDFGLEIFASGYPTSVPIACPAASVARNSVSGTTSARASRLTYDSEADQYNYLWVTQKGWAGSCRRLEVKFIGDANTYTLDFSFTR